MAKFDMNKEYSLRADVLRKNRVETSFYKYGSAADNFTQPNGVKAIPSMRGTIKASLKNG